MTPCRSREIVGTRPPIQSTSSIATRSTSRIWKTSSVILSSSALTSTARDSPFDTSSSSASFFSVRAGAVEPRAIGLEHPARFAERNTDARQTFGAVVRALLEHRRGRWRGVAARVRSSLRARGGVLHDHVETAPSRRSARRRRRRVALSTRAPFTKVPLLEPRSETSSTRRRASSQLGVAARDRSDRRSGRRRSPRVPPAASSPRGSSNDWVPLVETIRKGMAAICGSAGLRGEGRRSG